MQKNIKNILDEKNIKIDYKTDIEMKKITRVDRFKLIKELKEIDKEEKNG